MKNRIYLDNCCFNRPFDNQGNIITELETKAKLQIQEMIVNNELELVVSYILEYENDQNPFCERQQIIEDFFQFASLDVNENADVLIVANEIMLTGIKTKDALHIACAIDSECDYFITTDKRLLKYKNKNIQIMNPITFLLERSLAT